MSGISDLRNHLGASLLSNGEVDFLGAIHEGFPPELQFFRDNVRLQVAHIIQSITTLLVIACADTLNHSTKHNTITLFQDEKWDQKLLDGIISRLGSTFLYSHFLGNKGIGTTLLQYMKNHKSILLMENIALTYTDDGRLIVHKFAEPSPHVTTMVQSSAQVIHIFTGM